MSSARAELANAEVVAEAVTSRIGIVGAFASTAVAALVPLAVAVTSRSPPLVAIASAPPEGFVSVTVSPRISVSLAAASVSSPSPSIVVVSWPEPWTSTCEGMLNWVVPRS